QQRGCDPSHTLAPDGRRSGAALPSILSSGASPTGPADHSHPGARMILTTPTFASGGRIPTPCTCDGENRSPGLQWPAIPVGTRSCAPLCDDPDARGNTWVHWVLFNLPADAIELKEGVPKVPALPSGARQGSNDRDEIGYAGPCPPAGQPHRYFFRLYALDCMLNLSPGVKRPELDQAMTGHVLAEAAVMGTYAR